MGVDAEELILNPFQEVVDRGKDAVANAEGAADDDAELSRLMAKAGVAVVKEGERALKRLQPLWDGQVEKYGDAFKESLSQNAAIEEKRRKLEDLLYDFEDYAEPDTFEPARFTELQAATKSLAMDVIEIIKKMRLDTPITPPYSPPSPSKFPPLPPLPPLPLKSTSRTPEIPDFPVPLPLPQTGMRTTVWVSDQAGNSNPRYHGHRAPSRYEPHSLQAIDNLQQTTIPEDQAVTASMPSRRAGHSFINFDTPLTPIISELGRFGVDSPPGDSSPSAGPNSPGTSRSATLSHATSMSSVQTDPAHIKPGNGGRTPVTPGDNAQPKASFSPIALPPAAIEGPESHGRLPDAATAATQASTSEDWATRTVLSISDPASTANFSSGSQPHPRGADCAIGPRSSLYLLRGFCAGAQQFRSSGHEDGVRRVAGHVAGQSTATARCASCSYGHAWSELDLDVRDRLPRATFPREGGLLFRIRILYKSHLGAPRPSEAFYGCLFCAHVGRVVREGDATVFRGADDLFRHLTSHPQPLPEVQGLTVLYGKEVLATDPRVNDFDLWLTEPPQPGGIPPEAEAGVARLPVATAVKGHVQRYGEKKLPKPDGKSSESLVQFFEGSRIIGVEYPAKYGGKWCTGWHDGIWGYFPSKCIELEKPKPGRLDAPPLLQGIGGSGVVAVSKWKWDPGAAAKEGWLGFDKGEKLTNVGWPADMGKEAWCWSGSTSKGKFGVFPKSHIDESSLRDDTSSPAPGSGGGKSKKKEGGGRPSSQASKVKVNKYGH
ncbi:putative sh3 domain containing protein [Diaporthe ampelina]|uniref:Putative sh3 domain containing protein n=1 Tax=Diaporthe ampelina TaxID=1214573 RepID=A0A0G2FRG9_9PEZI|nr:putative sh3 domain containing protein [Diaporthe ampelina]